MENKRGAIRKLKGKIRFDDKRVNFMSEDCGFYVSTVKISKDGKKMYAIDAYSFNIYEINLTSGIVQIIGRISNEEESVNTIFEIHICTEALVMIPRNGKYMHIFNLRSKKDLIVDLKEKSSFKKIYNCFSICDQNQIYIINRDNAKVFKYDFVKDDFEKVADSINTEKLQLTDSYVEGKVIYMPSLSKHNVIAYDIPNRTIFQIRLPNELSNVIKVYVWDEEIMVYKNDNHCIYILNFYGEIIHKYNTMFVNKHIDPFFYKEGAQLYVFGNSGGEMCKIDLVHDTVENQIIDELKDMHIDYLEMKNGFLYCVLMTQTYERVLNYFITIDIETMQIIKQKIKFEDKTIENSIRVENEENINNYLNKKKYVCENCVVDLGRFVRFLDCKRYDG